jgi:hypothetical protein
MWTQAGRIQGMGVAGAQPQCQHFFMTAFNRQTHTLVPPYLMQYPLPMCSTHFNCLTSRARAHVQVLDPVSAWRNSTNK